MDSDFAACDQTSVQGRRLPRLKPILAIMSLCAIALGAQAMAQSEDQFNDSLCVRSPGKEKKVMFTVMEMTGAAIYSWTAKPMAT